MSDKPGAEPLFSLVVSTLGRTDELARLLQSLAQQSERRFEVIVVDQNDDDRLKSVIQSTRREVQVTWLRTPNQRGLSRGRNQGWRRAKGKYVLFPDDDCWYPDWLLAAALAEFTTQQCNILAGRAADLTGRSINGRFEPVAQAVDRSNVWTTQIEWMVFFEKSVLEATRGFDEAIGVGAASPWQACEGQDIMVRALDAGFGAHFDPTIYGHHAELNVKNPDIEMRRKGRAYGRGMGRVLGKHHFGALSAGYWIARPFAKMVLSLFLLKGRSAAYFANVFAGRLEGYLGLTFSGT
jgi:glycosyltransferase involved in cell wall biosynthesis